MPEISARPAHPSQEGGGLTVADAAIGYADFGWAVLPLRPGAKTPATRRGHKDATADPDVTTWPAGANIGIATGAASGLVAVDIDIKNGALGLASLDELDLPATLTARTASGGLHLYYRHPGGHVPCKVGWRPGIDIRADGGYVVAPPSTAGGGRWSWADEDPVVAGLLGDEVLIAELPVEIARELRSHTERPKADRTPLEGIDPDAARRRAIHYLTNEAPTAYSGERNHAAFRVACRLKDLGVAQDDCAGLMLEHWHGCEPMLEVDELEHCARSAFRYGVDPPGAAAPEAEFTPVEVDEGDEAPSADHRKAAEEAVDELNKQFAVAWAGGRVVILRETEAAPYPGRAATPAVEFVRREDFHAWFKNDVVKIVEGGHVKTVPVSRVWESSRRRRQYASIDFRPEGAPPEVYNLWRGFSVEPDPHASCDLFLDHVRENVCGGDEGLYHWALGWFAQIIQRPWEKSETALVLRGGQGAGKSIAGNIFGALLGPHHVVVSSPRLITGQFNAHLEGCLLLQAEEAFWAGDKQAEGRLKDLVTGHVHMIEHKGVDPIPVRNLVRLFATSNSRWVVPAGMDERRFAVLDVSDARARDHDYFGAIQRQMDSGGLGALLYYLLHFDLSSVNLRALPATKALLEQKEASLPPAEAWWLDCLTRGDLGGFDGWPAEVYRQTLFRSFRDYARERGIRHQPSDTWLGRSLREFTPWLRTVRRDEDGARGRAYLLPTLDECRQHFGAMLGRADWQDDPD